MKKTFQTATFAAGCFWGIEKKFLSLRGVIDTKVGYSGGKAANPSYEQVCFGNTGHAEVVQVYFSQAKISYNDLLVAFFQMHNAEYSPMKGQYRSEIFYHSVDQKKEAQNFLKQRKANGYKDTTAISAFKEFYLAEEYHQRYYMKNTAKHYWSARYSCSQNGEKRRRISLLL